MANMTGGTGLQLDLVDMFPLSQSADVMEPEDCGVSYCGNGDGIDGMCGWEHCGCDYYC